MKKIDFFVSVIFYLENEIKEIFLDFLESQNYFLSVTYRKEGVKEHNDFWFFETLFYNKINKVIFLKKFNILRKHFGLSPFRAEKISKNLTFGFLHFKKIKDQDWILNNKKILKPLIVNRYYIFDDEHYNFNRKPLLIPIKIKASYAFGSGYHETTKNCLRAISFIFLKKKFNSFLDFGSGSGILGICFKKKFKTSKTVFVDNDNRALNLTKVNLKKNNLNKIGNVFYNPWQMNKYYRKHYYDVVVANILFDPLKVLIKDFNYMLKKNSYLIISGILYHQKFFLINKYRKFNFFIYKTYCDNNWITIIFKRRV